MKKKFICAVLIICAICFSLCGCGESSTVHLQEKQSVSGRFLSDGPECYIVTDSETGAQYLFCDYGYSGGLTLLVDANGNPCLANGYEK